MSKEDFQEGYNKEKEGFNFFDHFVNPFEDPDSEEVKDREKGREAALNEDPFRMP